MKELGEALSRVLKAENGEDEGEPMEAPCDDENEEDYEEADEPQRVPWDADPVKRRAMEAKVLERLKAKRAKMKFRPMNLLDLKRLQAG